MVDHTGGRNEGLKVGGVFDLNMRVWLPSYYGICCLSRKKRVDHMQQLPDKEVPLAHQNHSVLPLIVSYWQQADVLPPQAVDQKYSPGRFA